MSEFKKHILIIEDEVDIAELLEFNLEKAGYQISVSENGESGLDKARNLDPDLILLDLMLPGIHGLDVCRILNSDQETEATSIIIITALGQEENIVKGLEAGADDYVTKPFSLKVLLARIQSVLRRGKVLDIDSEKSVHIENISIRPRTREVMVDKRKIDFTFTEFEILYLLASHPGWVFTRYQMIDKIRGDNYPVTERSIDFQIVGLRKNLGDAGNLIETIRGVGYRFKSNDT